MKPRKMIAIAAAVAVVGGLALVSNASANLTGSPFEGGDGNMVVNTAGNTDWANAPHLHVGPDLATGSADNSFVQGTKEDNVNISVGTGTIPNSKADIGRFAVADETLANGDVMMYLAWTRNNTSGTTNFDFEINKAAQPDLTTIGAKTLNRSVGDLLFTYDFQGGAQKPTIGLKKWNGSAWADSPLGAGTTEAEVARVSVASTIGGPTPVPAFQFGEGAINMTAAGIIPNQNDPNAPCTGFGSAYVKSRSSNSFTSELKDFVAPIPVDLNTCATLIVKKVTNPSPDPTNTSFPFTSNVTGATSFNLANGGSKTLSSSLKPGTYNVAEQTPAGWNLASATCSDGSPVTAISIQASETVTCTFTNEGLGHIIVNKHTDPAGSAQSFDFVASYGNFSLVDGGSHDSGAIPTGNYSVAETVPAHWLNTSATCDDGSDPSSIALAPGETVTCDFDNQLQVGAIRVNKTRIHKADGPGEHPHAGVSFEISGPSGTTTITTDANGTACADGLFFGDYTVHEVPVAGYASNPDQTATVDTVASCGDAGEEVVPFVNVPLTDIHVQVDSQVDGGTSSTIDCGDGTAGPADDVSTDRLNLTPGTYTCTVVIDP